MKPRIVHVTFANPEDAAWFMHCVNKQRSRAPSRVAGHTIGLLLDSLASATAASSPDLTEAQCASLREGREIE